ncbi:MAG: histidyl-tRNA synthetase [Acidobacteria bacterium]|nr:histidyl-tRNA synthetase [Acidobacteriota bacterium]
MVETLLNTVPGTRDILPGEIWRWQRVEECARQIFTQYGFMEIRTPIMESTELFARGIGGDTDIVGKEMYTFEDRSGKSITLRPEATASVVRAYIQNALYRGAGLAKLYYVGPMFRHEKKQKGRWRQFYQIGAEALGSDHPAIEAEVIEMLLSMISSLQIETKLLVNSVGCVKCRARYIQLLRGSLAGMLQHLCDDCRRRAETNSLRVFDCKVESCQPHIQKLPAITDHLCVECANHFASFKGYLAAAGIGYQVVPRLVRGLDYYVRTAFEIVSGELGAQNALAGGGRYDGLSEVLGGPPVKGFGFALGLDRLVMLLPDAVAMEAKYKPEIFLAYIGDQAFRQTLSIARALRRQGRSCYFDFDGGSLKSQMRMANKLNASYVLIIGEEELAKGLFKLKRLEDSAQWDVTVEGLPSFLAESAALANPSASMKAGK